jgi:hypothetical protein
VGERGRAKQQEDRNNPHHHRRPTPLFQKPTPLCGRGTILRTMFTELGRGPEPAPHFDPDISENEYEAIPCPACTGIHLVNRKTGKLLSQVDE